MMDGRLKDPLAIGKQPDGAQRHSLTSKYAAVNFGAAFFLVLDERKLNIDLNLLHFSNGLVSMSANCARLGADYVQFTAIHVS